VFSVKGKYKLNEKIDDQMDKPEREHEPNGTKKYFAAFSFFVDKSNNISNPCEHGQKHKQKVQDAIKIQKRKQGVYMMIFIQNTPYYVRNKITISRGEKMGIANNRPSRRVLSLRTEREVL
jgi:hypothetical protein